MQQINLEETENVLFNAQEVKILKLNETQIWEKRMSPLIFGVELTNESLSPKIVFSKEDNSETIVDWGDGTTSTSTTVGDNLLTHTYSNSGSYNITINSEGFIKLIAGCVTGGEKFDSNETNPYFAILKSLTIGEVVNKIGDDIVLNYRGNILFTVHDNLVEIGDNALKLFNCVLDYSGNEIQSTDGVLALKTTTGKYYIISKTGVVSGSSIDFSNISILILAKNSLNLSLSSNLTSFRLSPSIKYYSTNSINTTANSTIYFLNPAGMTVHLPNAGDGSGLMYSKNAKAITIYTDNETIKNYDWATDNITATIYHLDGSAWE